jgi:hypothetical protein
LNQSILSYGQENNFTYEYDFLIITPDDYVAYVQPLAVHKEVYGIMTKIVSLDEIYQGAYFSVKGRDEAEIIKYFIKDSRENWNIEYVMLIGGKDVLPARYVDICSWDEHFEVISELYYADIYDSNGGFCSWDSNNDDVFAGQTMDGLEDEVDLDPDIALGRLLCRNVLEVQNIVEKIIDYENNAYDETWFSNIVLCGGDFAELGLRERSLPRYFDRTGRMVWEGEFIGDNAARIMEGFNAKKIYSSGLIRPGIKFLTVKNINSAINEGAGFVLFVGHGNYNIAMKTNFPLCKNLWLPYPDAYYSSDCEYLSNGDKLPVAIFAGCSCGDFGSVDSPIAWEFVNKKDGGSIASFAATTGSQMIFSSLCTQTFTPLLILDTFRYFKDEIDIIGDIWIKILHTYLENGDAWSLGDEFSESNWDHKLANILVLEEWALFGDPTLKIGGYP